MGDQVWRLDRAVPRLSFCGDVSRYSAEYIEGQVNKMQATLTATFGAATAWTQTADKLTGLASTLRRVAQDLSGGWSSEDSVRCQEALQRIHDTAQALSSRSRELANFTDQAGQVMEHAVNTFSTDSGPGMMETAGSIGGGMIAGNVGSSVMGTIGSGFDSALDTFGIGGGPSKDEVAREHLARWNQSYTEVNPMLPERVSAELPQIRSRGGRSVVEPPGGYTPGSIPGTGGGGGWTPGGYETGVDDVSGVPPTGGFSARDLNPAAAAGYESDEMGGLASAGVYLPPPGAGGLGAGGIGTPGTVTPTGGGFAGAASLAPGAPVGARGSLGGAGAAGWGAGAAGRGAAGAAGRGGAGGVAGGGGTTGARGGAGGVRGGVPGGRGAVGGMVGAPTAGGAARGSGGGAGGSRGAGPLAGARATTGRGAGGGMVPMAGGGRGAGRDEDSHDSWLVEDEDPWRGDGDAPPSVIG